ncbi:MAG: NAD(P)-dependent oxidoreductase [Candidatus Thermoplasmatota archaeon]|nr:NAD(P)-dependent oxidoreductase [Candidatus Thermoplasmatota archaeon]
MKIVVTGANGYVGSALTHKLASEGYTVYAMTHHDPLSFAMKNVTYFTGDITDRRFVKHVVSDADAVVHCAAKVLDYGPLSIFEKVNIIGTQNLLDACPAHLQRFIYLGHIPYEWGKRSAYTQTKWVAEQLIQKAFKNQGFPGVIIRPGNVYGPGAGTWVIRPLKAIQKKRIALIDHGTGIFLHTFIDNLIDALILALKKPDLEGEIFDVTDGDNTITWKQYLNDLADMVHQPPISLSLSKTTALWLARFAILVYQVIRIKPLITPMAVQIFTNQKTVSIQHAQTHLGYTPHISYSKGIEQIRTWVQHEYLTNSTYENL